jgi:hypothetical protein
MSSRPAANQRARCIRRLLGPGAARDHELCPLSPAGLAAQQHGAILSEPAHCLRLGRSRLRSQGTRGPGSQRSRPGMRDVEVPAGKHHPAAPVPSLRRSPAGGFPRRGPAWGAGQRRGLWRARLRRGAGSDDPPTPLLVGRTKSPAPRRSPLTSRAIDMNTSRSTSHQVAGGSGWGTGRWGRLVVPGLSPVSATLAQRPAGTARWRDPPSPGSPRPSR